MKWFILFVLLIPAAMACVTPSNNMAIDESVELCTGVYFLNDGIKIEGNNMTLDCVGTVLKSWSGGKGISIQHVENVTIKGCRLLHYTTGLYVRNASSVFLLDNHLVHNKEGTRFVLVEDSATFNHDVSLTTPITVLQSKNNVISFSNRVVSGTFCENNYCNKPQKEVEKAMVPETTGPELKNWLGNVIGGKTAKRLHEWVFASLTRR